MNVIDIIMSLFFFSSRRRHTRWPRDWSSDVCSSDLDPTKAIAVVLQAEDTRFALLVDQLLGQHQVVVKNLETNYKKIPGISAATILGDGSVALIVDVFALHRMNRDRAGGRSEEHTSELTSRGHL